MKRYLVCKIVCAAVLGALAGAGSYSYYTKWNLQGKEAFLAHESTRFDTYMANPTLMHSIAAGTFAIVCIGLYEGLSSILKILVSPKR